MIKKKVIKKDDKQAMQDWEALKSDILNSSSINSTDTPEQIRARKTHLEAHPEEWFKYYFPVYCSAEPAPFHLAATVRLLEHRRWIEVRAWSRELAKSARSMMEVVYLTLTGKIKTALWVSYCYDNAERLLAPIRLTLESSRRIEQDYGVQKKPGSWETGEFTTTGGVSFRAIGAGQSPRGTRNEAARPDFVCVDDIDTDEACRNPERVKQVWQWVTEALIPAMSVSSNRRVLFNGNIIAKDCVVKRAMAIADHVDIINIRDKRGRSSWPQKNSEEDIDGFLSKLPTSAVQKEFYNNPVSEGDVFKEMTYGKCPPLDKLAFAVVYGDPSPSNKSRSKGASYKCVSLLGFYSGKYYLYKCRLEQTTTDNYLEWFYDMRDTVGGRCPTYFYNENNALQDPFWEQVYIPALAQKATERGVLPIAPDARGKGDKFARIEATLEPLNRTGVLILNEEERGNPHMERMEEQFKLVSPGLPSPADGPDCVEGGIFKINEILSAIQPDSIVIGQKSKKRKRY